MKWDLIVVGAGAAGAVIAARASEDPDQRVLMLEAGPDYLGTDGMPDDLLDGTRNSVRLHDWGLRYLPAGGRPVHFPRGKVVGGSTAVNTTIALRGAPEDYDAWAAAGLPAWSWAQCLPAFRRLERDEDFQGELHGAEGPVPIRRARPEELVPFQAAFLEACASLGLPACADHNDPGESGHAPLPMNRRGKLRVSSKVAYLDPARGRPNLEIRGGAHARRVVIEGGRALGVEIESGGRRGVVEGARVALCAGAIHSPALLVRSGIGPREVLERLGVPVIADLPVGARLLDHPGTLIALVAREGTGSFDHPMIQTALRYTAEGSAERNDMILQPLSFLQIQHAPLLFGIAAVVQKPYGRGRLSFTSADPHAQPVILPDLLADPRDRARLVAGVLLAKEVAATEAIRRVSYGVLLPTADDLDGAAVVDRWIRSACGSGFHPCGTTPMGPPRDPDAVVDQHGRGQGRRSCPS
jgi:choline dehydrogenase